MKVESSAAVARAVAYVALAVVGVCALYYVFSPVPPYGFYYDLGGHIAATAMISNWMRSPIDVWDAFGWAGWGERTAFTYAPMTVYVIVVPLAKLLGGNAFAAVKAMQVVDLAVSWAAASYLYVVLRGRSSWAWIAGLVYALLPEQILMIRGNMEFGFVTALAPLALAWPLVLTRRYGLAALPFCGALIGLLSTDVVVEYAIFIGIPACFVAIANAYDSRRRGLWALASLGCFAAFLGVAAYTAIPTFASHALFAAPAAMDALLQNGEFSIFAEGALALAALMLNESVANPRPEFSLGWTLWLALPLGVLIWSLAAGWVVRCIRRRAFAPGEGSLMTCAVVCAAVSMGSTIPGMGVVWWIIARLPGFNMVRTPDRFIALVIPILCVAAVSALEYVARRAGGRRLAYSALAAVSAVSFTLFFVYRIFSGDTYSIEERQPHFDSINAVAQSRDNRAVNLALVDDGSVFDTSLYAMMMPNLDFASDFTQRYEGDGLGGTGMLARANVATVIASPPWTKDSPLLAQSAIARASFLAPLEGDATTVTAFGVEPVRGYVHPVEPSCLDGGPGMLDYLEALPAFSSTAFVPNGRTCARTLYADDAPAEAILKGTIAAGIAGTTLFPNSGVLRDIDYRIALGRFFLNVPWYRNSIDGDSPQIGDGAVSLDPGNKGSASFTVANASTYAVAFRAVCHGAIRGTIAIDGGPGKPLLCAPARGFSWIEIPVGRLAAGSHRLDVAVATIDTDSPIAQTTWHFGVDGVDVVDLAAAPKAQAAPPAFAFSASRLATASSPMHAAPALALTSAPGFETIAGSQDPARELLLARDPDATAVYRFSGEAGRYRISAVAYSDASASGGSFLGILSGRRCCAAVSTLSEERGPELFASATLSLRAGDPVGILLHTAANDPGAISQLLSVTIEPDPKFVVADEGRSHYGAWFDFLARARKFTPQIPAGPTPVPGYAPMEPYAGFTLWPHPLTLSAAGFPPGTAANPTSVTASLVGPGAALVRLTCGADSVTGRLISPGGDVTLPPNAAPNCTATFSTSEAGLFVREASITRAIARIDLSGLRWIAGGTYRIQAIRRGANPADGTISVDGRPVSNIVKIASSGFHRLRWEGAPADAYLVTLVPLTWPSNAPPIVLRQDASLRWSVHLDRPATLESAVLSDGNWHLSSAQRSLGGASCDLENTCFENVPAGDYRLDHSWPGYIFVGFAITQLAWLAAAGLLVRRARRT